MNDIKLLLEILSKENPSFYIKKNEEYIFGLIPELEKSKGFNQNSPWHVYDVYEHTLHVVDNVPNNKILRMSALFHDIGKPFVYTEDEKGVGHFYGHYKVSKEIFDKFANKYNIDNKETISNLIYLHDLKLGNLEDEELNKITSSLGVENIMLLYELKRADLLAQNSKYYYQLEEYDEEEKKVLWKMR